jgi:CHAT domain-containing protein
LKKPKILACCLLAFLFLGGAPKSRPMENPWARRPDSERSRRTAALRGWLLHGAELHRSGRYVEASRAFEDAFREATSLSEPDWAGRALGDLGASQFLLHQYKSALQSFLQARRLSESAGDTRDVPAWDADIASLYSTLGEWDAAAEWTQRSLGRSRRYRPEQLPKLQIEMANLRALQGRAKEAESLFREGIDSADRAGDMVLYATGWHNFGWALFKEGDLPRAEPALLEAYRTRKLHHLPLDSSYLMLGRLRLAQGDLPSASALLDQAIEAVTAPGSGNTLQQTSTPAWYLFYSRALVRQAQGRLADALSDLRIAMRLGRAWRWSAPANESLQIGAEGMLDQVHSALVETGNRLYLETREAALKEETFTANEENRAVSLRTLWNTPEREGENEAVSELPGGYWEALMRLQRAELTALKGGDTAGLAAARADLVRMEASLTGDFQGVPEDLPEATRHKLDPGTALFSFHLGTSNSWLWAVDREGIEVYRLPGRGQIEPQVQAVTAAIRQDRPEAAAISENLYAAIFGPAAPRFRNAPRWLLALDGALFDLPISALIEESGAGRKAPGYVATRHTVELIPGVAYWLESGDRPAGRLSDLFVGVGDPVYNRADERAAALPPRSAPSLLLPRLVGSGAEITACARAWNGPSVLLDGRDASRQKFMETLQESPAAVHVATHYVVSAGKARYSLIALSLLPTGDSEVLSPAEISHWQIHAGLVVLSGCHSAAGATLPGEGVMGLTRAWLAAGARSVIGSLWDTPDDQGPLFGELYRNLRAMGRLDAARALREAQLNMIRKGGRFASPSYWGTYFSVSDRDMPLIPRVLAGGER